jgi:formylglycine-generating enzyme required for sulfatase activity
VTADQPALHITRHEAEAWCRWAGRRLPTEPEWELAATLGRSRGFVWGDVFEWVAGSARPWPGHAATPGTLDPMPPPRTQGVLRGASWMTRPRRRHASARRFAAVDADTAFCGFRSCAL